MATRTTHGTSTRRAMSTTTTRPTRTASLRLCINGSKNRRVTPAHPKTDTRN
nr:MAG TPA: hypothetical protein [Caudoviricetes sp.]